MSRHPIEEAFLEECAKSIDAMEAAVLQLPAGMPDADAVGGVFRVAHSIKGSAATIGLAEMSSFAHALESLLEELRAQRMAVTPRVTDALMQSIDLLRLMIASRGAGRPVDPQQLADVQLELALLVATTGSASPGLDPADGRHTASVRVLDVDRIRGDAEHAIRVSLSQVESLIEQVSRVSETHRLLSDAARGLPDSAADAVRGLLGGLGRAVTALRSDLGDLRTVPIRAVFDRLPRMIRDLSLQLGKNVEIRIVGGGVRIDAAVVEQLAGALVHLARNAIDHGIEPPATRVAAGKPDHGTLCLQARSEDGATVVELSDDGAGLSREAILRRARDERLVREDAELTEAEVDELIFLPGLSTLDEVTEVSGRGVGMDVVRRNMQRIGATVRITSAPGRGCSFAIVLPRKADPGDIGGENAARTA